MRRPQASATGAANSHHRVVHAGTAGGFGRADGGLAQLAEGSPMAATQTQAPPPSPTSAQEQPRPMAPHGSAPPPTQQRLSGCRGAADGAPERGARGSNDAATAGHRPGRERRESFHRRGLLELGLDGAARRLLHPGERGAPCAGAQESGVSRAGFGERRWGTPALARAAGPGGGPRGRRAAQRQIAGRGSRGLELYRSRAFGRAAFRRAAYRWAAYSRAAFSRT